MMPDMKKIFALLVVTAVSLMQFGCGEGGETNVPAVKLTASTVVSSTDSAHQHSVSIPFVDVSAAPLATGYQYRSDTVAGHSHVIALSQQQMMDLNNGMQLTLVSSAPSFGVSHTHTWTIQGGGVLYDKSCYNCHSNDKRNQSPASNSKMGTSLAFNANQAIALVNPAAAPQSTAVAAIPDPNFTPVATTPDGAALYAGACAGCHGALASSAKSNRSAAQIKAAILGVAAMNGLSTLTDAQIQAIATALVR